MSDHLLYNEKIMDRFINPQNVGDIENPDAIAEVGAAACGDVLRITLKIDPDTHKVLDAKAKIFGCGTAISAADMAKYIVDFTLTGNQYYNGKVLEVSSSNP